MTGEKISFCWYANFVYQACNQFRKSLKKVSSSAKALFLDYPWPGNIRELKSVVESAVMVSDGDYITLSDLPMNLQNYATGHREEIGTKSHTKHRRGRRQPLPQVAEEPLGIGMPLEADDGVVGIADDDDLDGRPALAPLVHPEVVDVVQVDVRQQRRDHRALRRALHPFRPRPLLHDPGLQPFGHQPEHTAVADPVLQEPHHPRVADAVEEGPDVGVQDPVHLSQIDPVGERVQRVVLRAPGTEPVGEAEEVRLVDSVQHLHERALDDLVLQRRDAERPLPAVGLRDVLPHETGAE